jgi:hypothetical protein
MHYLVRLLRGRRSLGGKFEHGFVRIAVLGSLLFWALIVWLVYCADYNIRGRGLPHRPVDTLTNWGQGRAPESNECGPGQVRFEIEPGFFLECFRGSTN